MWFVSATPPQSIRLWGRPPLKSQQLVLEHTDCFPTRGCPCCILDAGLAVRGARVAAAEEEAVGAVRDGAFGVGGEGGVGGGEGGEEEVEVGGEGAVGGVVTGAVDASVDQGVSCSS